MSAFALPSDEGDSGAAEPGPIDGAKGAWGGSFTSGGSLIFWLEGGESALLRRGESGANGAGAAELGFASGGACSTPSLIGDLGGVGDRGGVELDMAVGLGSKSSLIWRRWDGGDMTAPGPLFWTKALSGLRGRSAGKGCGGMRFSGIESGDGVSAENSLPGGGERGVLIPSGRPGLRGEVIIALGLASPLAE